MEEGSSNVGILAEERRHFLLLHIIVNCQTKCMKGEKQVFPGVPVVLKRLRNLGVDRAGAKAWESVNRQCLGSILCTWA